MGQRVERVWVLKDEYKDWQVLANAGDRYDGVTVTESRAFEYIHDEEDIDYDDYLIWYAKTHPNEEPMIADIVKDKEAMVTWFFNNGEWMKIRPLALIGGHAV